jgi:hypothetical protein
VNAVGGAPGGAHAQWPPAGAQQWPPPATPSEWCPLCGSALAGEQDWCLQCGAAARTRLAATPRWKAPVITFALVIVICLGVLIASLVKLIG